MFFVTGRIILIIFVNIIAHFLRQQCEDAQESAQSSSGLQCCRFSLAEINWATQNFDKGLVIGKGGFGEVYKGTIDNGATTVAIKRLCFWSNQGAHEFWTEIEMLSTFRHSHLVSLIGYCNEHSEMIIVYEYMPGGTLADHLHKMSGSSRPLSWIQRLRACLGAARGLDYLHTGTNIQTRVIHRDVKSSNILLDANCEAKISDFGLSKIGPAEQLYTHVSTRVKGTFGYLDPEYLLTRRLTRKSDVYAFGVVMFEVLCGRPAVDRKLDEEQWGLAKWAKRCIKEGRVHEIVDPHLNGSILSDCLETFAQIAEQCLHGSSRKRPTMAEVVTRLEYALSLQETTSFSLIDTEIISSGGNYDSQEDECSSTETDDNQSQIQVTKRITPVKKAERFIATKDPFISAYPSLSPHLKRFSWAELKVATSNFSKKNILSKGGLDIVYKGRLLDGSLVSIKRLKMMKRTQGGDLQFQNEMKISTMANHRNLLRLRGFCTREPTDSTPIERKRIALQAARGLAYLHEDCIPRIIHCNIKASKLLLYEDFETCIGDFGLAELMDRECPHVSTAVRGTIGHIAPEYLSTGKCSLKTDVYGYGIMLLELVTARMAFDLDRLARNEHVMLKDWVKGLWQEELFEMLVIDGDLNGNYIYKEVEQLVFIALLCTHDSSTERPRMSEVVKMLEGDGLGERWSEWQVEKRFIDRIRSL